MQEQRATENQSEQLAPTATELQLVKTTLAEMGPNLPVGFADPAGGPRVRSFRLRPFRLKEEKELGALRDKARGMTFGQLASDVVSLMAQTIGPHTMDGKRDREKALLLSMMPMADVIYMYLWLRYEAMGPEEPLSMHVTCPACRKGFQFDADLGTLEVKKVPDDAKDLRHVYTMRNGFVIQGDVRKRVWIEPLKWLVAESREYNMNIPGVREGAITKAAIVGADGVTLNPFVITDSDLDELTKYDLSGIQANIAENTPGPMLAVEAACPTCKTDIVRTIDWGYDSFFSRSSRQSRGRT